MNNKHSPFVTFLRDFLKNRGRLPSQMADAIGISHSTISRWLSGKYIPSSRYCQKISEYTGTPLESILAMVGHITEDINIRHSGWPEFREYATKMYPDELDEDTITLIEDIIEYRRNKKKARKKNR